MSKRTGPTRIPVFGTRIPIPGAPVNPVAETLVLECQDSEDKSTGVELSNKDVGRKVRVGDKEGALRYVGNVHFASGVWCGIELSYPVGKNDGSVRGVRYFQCNDSHGLMAPLAKVALADGNTEDPVSGPYSMLFGLKEQLLSNCTFRNSCNDLNITKEKARPLIKSNTFDKLDASILDVTIRETKNSSTGSTEREEDVDCDYFLKDDNEGFNRTIVHSNVERETYNFKEKDHTFCIQERTQNDKTIIIKKSDGNISYTQTNESYTKSEGNKTFNTQKSETFILKNNSPQQVVKPQAALKLQLQKDFSFSKGRRRNYEILKSLDLENAARAALSESRIGCCENNKTIEVLNDIRVLQNETSESKESKLRSRLGQHETRLIQEDSRLSHDDSPLIKNEVRSVQTGPRLLKDPKSLRLILNENRLNQIEPRLNQSEVNLNFTDSKRSPLNATYTFKKNLEALKKPLRTFSTESLPSHGKVSPSNDSIIPFPKRRCFEENSLSPSSDWPHSLKDSLNSSKTSSRLSIISDESFQRNLGHSTPVDNKKVSDHRQYSRISQVSIPDTSAFVKRDSFGSQGDLPDFHNQSSEPPSQTIRYSKQPPGFLSQVSCGFSSQTSTGFAGQSFSNQSSNTFTNQTSNTLTNQSSNGFPNQQSATFPNQTSGYTNQITGYSNCSNSLGFVNPSSAGLSNQTLTFAPTGISFSNQSSSFVGQPSYSNQSSFGNQVEDDAGKRDSLEFEESLGILTPEQMMEVGSGFVGSRTPSSENLRSLTSDLQNVRFKGEPKPELGGPNVVDASTKDFSLGIIDEQMLTSFTMKDAANMELALDAIKQTKEYNNLSRLEQTPSPEDLPLDPIPIVDVSKVEPGGKQKSVNSFITSITSITSLDTGYQGDGEMSRPASRGADNSPLTRRPLPRPQPRRPDPMTDSDFYTESDADNHEEHPFKGDRKAQVIDGTLYGVDPQAAADIYVNNRENMDSSGIFTDIESNPRTEDISTSELANPNATIDVSPSESSTKTISDNSQGNVALIMSKSNISKAENNNETIVEANTTIVEIPKRSTPSPSTVASSPTSMRSPKHIQKDNNKNYRMPKRNVPSKVKAMMEPSVSQNENERKVPVKKTVGRWDAVMNKISKNPGEGVKTNLKDVKSKVFSASTPANLVQRPEVRKAPLRQQASQKSPSAKLRRVRARAGANTTPTKSATHLGSIHSSLSDVSGASPAKKNGSAKKRDVVRVTQVLTAAKLSPRTPQNNQNTANNEAKKTLTVPPTATEAKLNKRNVFNTKEKKQIAQKESGRATVKGGRVSPVTRSPQQLRAPIKNNIPRTAEALAVLVQHLVYNCDAFSVPTLKKELEKFRREANDAHLAYLQLEQRLNEESLNHSKLEEQMQTTITQMAINSTDKERQITLESEKAQQKILKMHEEQVTTFKTEFEKLQKNHEAQLDILREENDSIRDEIDDKNEEIARLIKQHKFESEKLRKDYEAKELSYKEQLQLANEEIASLKEENERIRNIACNGGNSDTFQEIQSLQVVLDLKKNEAADLRKSLAEALRKADQLPQVEEKLYVLTQKCEDLQLQLERKTDYEQQLIQEHKKLQDSFKEESNQKKRVIQHNEELQWKLRQNSEILTRVVEHADADMSFNRSVLSSSFSERRNSKTPNLDRTFSFRERTLSNASNMSDSCYKPKKPKDSDVPEDDINSPPESPKVKGLVEKSDSIGYVLELHESPEAVAHRIIRRSFRNQASPKSTPTKSPVNKRPRIKSNPLSLSMSASAIIPSMNKESRRSRSASVRNGDNDCSDDIFDWDVKTSSTPNNGGNQEKYEDENLDLDEEEDCDEINLPQLPSQIGRNHGMQTLPSPKHLAGEVIMSESNSEDESTNSSSSGQL